MGNSCREKEVGSEGRGGAPRGTPAGRRWGQRRKRRGSEGNSFREEEVKPEKEGSCLIARMLDMALGDMWAYASKDNTIQLLGKMTEWLFCASV